MQNIIFALIVVLILAFTRLVPHAPNFTPLLAIALWLGSQRVSKVMSTAILLGSLMISDLLIGTHPLMPVIYASLIVLLFSGDFLQDKILFSKSNFVRNTCAWLFAALFGSVFFFITTNLAVWWSSGMYPRTTTGLTECFVLALPFFNNTLTSTLIFSGVLLALSNLSFVKNFVAAKNK